MEDNKQEQLRVATEDLGNKVVIVGRVGIDGARVLHEIGEARKDKLIAIIGNHKNNTITVNGEVYEPIANEEPKPKRYGNSKMLSAIAMTSLMAGVTNYGDFTGGHTYSPERPNVDIVKEYALIQQKKSYLSSSDRAWVVRVFESKYKKVSNGRE